MNVCVEEKGRKVIYRERGRMWCKRYWTVNATNAANVAKNAGRTISKLCLMEGFPV
jgi:hypothetical protein